MKDHDELTDLAEMPFERGNAGKLVNQIRMLAKEERAQQNAATVGHSINMHGYAANRLEAVLLAFGVSNDWPNGDLAAPAVNAKIAAEGVCARSLEVADKEIARLRSAIQDTLTDNGHLADGENCTLIKLKRAMSPNDGAQRTATAATAKFDPRQ